MDKAQAENEFLKLSKSKGYKKISINITKEILNLIDEYAEMAEINRSLVINSVLQTGLEDYLKLIENSIKSALDKNTLEDENDRPKFIKFQKNLKEFITKNFKQDKK